jgi:predicted nucleic acid-binding protein
MRGLIFHDTSGLLAAIDSSQHRHAEAAAALQEAGTPLLLSPFALTELDYLLAARVSARHSSLFLTRSVEGPTTSNPSRPAMWFRQPW